MNNTRLYCETQEIIEQLKYDLAQVEQEIEEEWANDEHDCYQINQLEHQRRRIQQELELEEFIALKEAAE